jgi:selenium-binding protein 1
MAMSNSHLGRSCEIEVRGPTSPRYAEVPSRVGRASARLALLTYSAGVLLSCSMDTTPPAQDAQIAEDAEKRGTLRNPRQERFLYVTTIAQSPSDPDFIAVVGADPSRKDFGTIVNRVDMPNVGDELHHFNYSLDRKRLVVPGLFSNRIHVFDISPNHWQMRLRAVNEQVPAVSGYAVPHGVMSMGRERLLAPMIGAANAETSPGGIVEINDRTGEFRGFFGPGPERDPGQLAPRYMYDFDMAHDFNRGISTAFGPPALCAPGIAPTCLGDEVAVWNLEREEVVQVASLGQHSGALQVRFLKTHGVRRAFINTPGTSAIWLADDDDEDGLFEFQEVLGASDGLSLPADILISNDQKYLYVTNWFGNTVQQFDITDPLHPVLKSTVQVPHANMLRLSKDNSRLYVTNSLLTTWDNDGSFGPPRNTQYGIWLFTVSPGTGDLTSITSDGSAWVSFEQVQKKASVGPAGPHMMLFDPRIEPAPGEH